MYKKEYSDKDPYEKSAFSVWDKLRRLIWNLTWILLCRFTPAPFHSWRCFILKCFGATIGKRNSIYPSCKIWAPWLLETRDKATIGPDVEIYNPGGVLLDHHSILSQGAYLCGATHDYNSSDFTYIKARIVIESYAWVCAKAVVLPGVTCKTGSVLGAAAVTSKNLDSWAVYGGNPAKRIRDRTNFTDTLD